MGGGQRDIATYRLNQPRCWCIVKIFTFHKRSGHYLTPFDDLFLLGVFLNLSWAIFANRSRKTHISEFLLLLCSKVQKSLDYSGLSYYRLGYSSLYYIRVGKIKTHNSHRVQFFSSVFFAKYVKFSVKF